MSRISTTTSAPPRSARLRRAAGAALAALLLATPAAADDLRVGPGVAELVRGLFCAPPQTGRREAPDTMAGWIHVPDAPVELVAESTVAPAVLGMGFGVRFRRTGPDAAILRYEVTHPPIGTAGVTTQGWDSVSMAGDQDSIFFQFDLPEELVPGRWTFSARMDGQELFSAPFTVVPPERAPELAGLCRGGLMMSSLAP